MIAVQQNKINYLYLPKWNDFSEETLYDIVLTNSTDCIETTLQVKGNICQEFVLFLIQEKCDILVLPQGYYTLEIKENTELRHTDKVRVYNDRANGISPFLPSGEYFENDTYTCDLINANNE